MQPKPWQHLTPFLPPDPAALVRLAMADDALKTVLISAVVTFLRAQNIHVKGA